MSLGCQEAFEVFRQDHADSITIEDNKQLLKQKWVSQQYSSGFIQLIFIDTLKQCGNGICDHELPKGSKIHVTESITVISIVKNALLASALSWTVS